MLVDVYKRQVGETVLFTVRLTNTCQSPLTDLFLQDQFPSGFSFVPDTVQVLSLIHIYYVIVSFYLPDPSTPEERRAALLSEVANMLKVPQASLSTSLASFSPPTYEYMAYTAVQMFPDETCLQIISCDESLFKEAQNAILLMPTEERARYLHECVAVSYTHLDVYKRQTLKSS